MTVPPLFGWEGILIVLAIVVVVAVGYLVILAAGVAEDGRPEWQAWLDARSGRHEDHGPDPDELAAVPVRPEPSVVTDAR
ncbi:MAG: hypothetical protein JWR45_3496 [Blastococcus sp.]|jgi:hypothetical protein|nr:hypothetical protein [Blastococcus sp.]